MIFEILVCVGMFFLVIILHEGTHIVVGHLCKFKVRLNTPTSTEIAGETGGSYRGILLVLLSPILTTGLFIIFLYYMFGFGYWLFVPVFLIITGSQTDIAMSYVFYKITKYGNTHTRTDVLDFPVIKKDFKGINCLNMGKYYQRTEDKINKQIKEKEK